MAVKLCGAAYLISLGIQSLWSTRGGHAASGHGPSDMPGTAGCGRSPYSQGFLSAILNPKLVVFFATFLPQFLIGGRPVLPQMLLLGVSFGCMVVGWLIGYGLLVTRLRAALSAPAVRRSMERITGMVLIALGLKIVQSSA